MTTEELISLGLSDKEAELYLALLELGPSKAKDISAYTELNRGTIYDVARSLFKKGLVSSTQKKNITHFVASPPHRYIYQLNQEVTAATSLMPAIEDMIQSSSYRPVVRFFEGVEGIKTVYEETLRCRSKEIVCFVSAREILEVVGEEFMQYYAEKRTRRHIKIRTLNDPRGEISLEEEGFHMVSDPLLLRESRLGPSSIDVSAMMMIYDDSVALMSTKRENFGTILESHEYSTMLRDMFETMWSQTSALS
ncbi:MAG: helix-turn-helix domain-containing protein [bacterium]